MSVDHNDANRNSKKLPGYSGIAILGSDNIAVEHNEADNNGRGVKVTGSTLSSFKHNSAHGNAVLDLDWDSFGTMTFKNNHCNTANPSKTTWAAK